MHTATGIVHYDTKDGHWVTVWVSQDLADYYYSLIPKYARVVRPRWKAHITVLRPEENPTNLEVWGKHQGEIIPFVYNTDPIQEGGFWWLNLWSVQLEQIRQEHGLSIISRITKPPVGYSKTFHCTIAKDSAIA